MRTVSIFCIIGAAALLFLANTVSADSLRQNGAVTFDDPLFDDIAKVTGDNCLPMPSDVGYRPSLFECNGAAAVLTRGSQRNNYSIVVRRGPNIQYNDRDPNNTSCGTNRCSPYKTQRRIELPEFQVNCLGDSGFSPTFDTVQRVSIKYTAAVTNAQDSRQFQQYCLTDKKKSIN